MVVSFTLLLCFSQKANTSSFGGNFATPGPKHLDTAMSYVGYKERGKNRGSLPDKCNKMAGVAAGSSWCASFGYYCMKQAGLNPTSRPRGRARAYINKHSIDAKWVARGIVTAQPGWACIFANGLYNDNEINKPGHFGFVAEEWKGAHGRNVEANTSSGKTGSQSNGDGVYVRYRSIGEGKFRITHFTDYRYL